MSNTLVLTWNRQHVAAVQCGTGEPSRILKSWQSAWPEGLAPLQSGAEAGQWLATQLTTAGMTAPLLWLVVPREDVVLRHLELPNAPDEELADLVRFQASGRSTVPIEQLALDYLPLSPTAGRDGRDVLAATLPKAAVEQLRQLSLAVNRELQGISFSSGALGDWATQLDAEHPDAAVSTKDGSGTLVVGWHDGQVELAIVCERELTFAHVSRLNVPANSDPTTSILAEVSRTIVAGQRMRPQLKIRRAWLVGGSATLASAMEQRLGCSVQTVQPALENRQSEALQAIGSQPVLTAVLLGIRTPSTIPRVNFLKPRQPPPKRDPRKQKIAVAAAAVLMVSFLVGSGGLWRLQSLDRQIETRYKRTEELQSSVNAGKPLMDGARVLNDWELRNVNQLQLFGGLEEMMPGGYDRPYLSEYEYAVSTGDAVAKVAGNGAAKSRSDIETLLQELRHRVGYQVFPREVTTSRDPDYPHRFTLELNLPPQRPGAGSAAVKPAGITGTASVAPASPTDPGTKNNAGMGS